MKNVTKILSCLVYRQESLQKAIDVLGETDFIQHFSTCLDLEIRLDELQVLEIWIRETEKDG